MTSRVRRAVLVLAAVVAGLSTGAAAQAAPAAAEGRVQSALDYFALGDSIASGHGLGDAGPCRRSTRAYPQQVDTLLAARHARLRFRTFACSGAIAGEEAQGLKAFRSQVSKILGQLSPRPTLVSITIGINDFHWTDITSLYFLLRDSEAAFETWRTTITTEVQRDVERQLRRLLARRNVAVVLTEYANPVNTGSILFGPPFPCADFAACYERTERFIHGLNHAFDELRDELAGKRRLRIALVHERFHGHESPLSICGSDAPEIAGTWIQHPQDPASNSFPPVPPDIEAETGDWSGDCFHPNDAGAAAIAGAVDRAARSMGR